MKLIVSYFFALFTSITAFSQNSSVDNSNIVFQNSKGDTATINRMVDSSWQLINQGDYDNAILQANNAIQLAQKIKFSKGVIKALHQIIICNYYKGDFKKALSYNLKSLKFSIAVNDKKNIAASMHDFGNLYSSVGDYSKALKHFYAAMHLLEEMDDENGIASSHNNIGIIYFEQSNYPKALEHYLISLKIFNELKDEMSIASNLNNIANVYMQQNNCDKALNYYLQSLEVHTKLKNKNEIANVFVNISSVYTQKRDYLKTLEYNQKALDIFKKIGDKNGIARSLGNISENYRNTGDWNKALLLCDTVLKIQTEIGDKNGAAITLVNIGKIYTYQQKKSQAENYLNQGIVLAKKIGAIESVKTAEKILSELYEKLNDKSKALEHFKLYIIARDSIFNIANTKKITQAEMNFEFEKKEKEAKGLQEKKDLLLAGEINRRKIITTSIIIILILFISSLLLFFRQQQIKSKKDKIILQNKQVLSEKEKDLLEAEKKILEDDLASSRKILDNYTQSMLEKNALLEQFNNEIEKLKNLKSKELYEEKIEQLNGLTKLTIITENDWNKFKEMFEHVYKGFFFRLKDKYPDLTPAEIRLICLTKLKLENKQMASILGISTDTINKTRYRLRKKINDSSEESLNNIIESV